MAVHETPSPHYHPPLPSPVGSRVRSEDATPSPKPPAQPWSQVSVTPHTQTPLRGHNAFRVWPLCSTPLPHRGYVGDSPGPACMVSGGLARAPQAVSLTPEDQQTRLSDSFCLGSSQVQGRSVHLSVEQGWPCLALKNRGPAREGRDRTGSSSRDEIWVLQLLLHRTQERRWVTTNLGPAHSEPSSSQAPVQDVDEETRLICSNRPAGRLLPCLNPHSTRTVPPLCVRRPIIPVQGPPLWAIPVASCLHQGRRGSPCPAK